MGLMSAFTDNDLKRLKEICEKNIPESGFNIARMSLKALLARLELAEKVAGNCNCLSSWRDKWNLSKKDSGQK